MWLKPLLQTGVTLKLDPILEASFRQDLIPEDWRAYSFPGQPVLPRRVCVF